MAERFKAAVLKTVDGKTSGGSNPSLSASYYIKAILSRYIAKAGQRGMRTPGKGDSPQGEGSQGFRLSEGKAIPLSPPVKNLISKSVRNI